MTRENGKTILDKAKDWARRLKRELEALRIALADNLVPWYVKALIILTVGYALSPIDLIPDFIPVIGLLDDLIIVPVLIFFTVKLIPTEVMQHCRKEAETRQLSNKKNWIAGGIIILFWLILAAWLVLNLVNEEKR